jgi:acetylornithine deacetylase
MASVRPQVHDYVKSRSATLTRLVQELVRRPSENRAPHGSERACQEFIAESLRAAGWEPALYTPDQVSGITGHPLYWPGRDYTDRPNVGARWKGAGGGRSLVLSGHVDTVPVGAEPWSRDPFGGTVEGNRLYGRGSNDMKCGIATNLFVCEALRELDIRLKGDLVFESVVDEEFGGVNGTLAGRLSGFNADAAVISEPSCLRICPAQRGGRTVHITFRSPNDGILGGAQASAVEQLRLFLNRLPEFQAERLANAPAHGLYRHLANPVPVTVARVHTAAWGTSEPPNVPPICRVELFWQAVPGESVESLDRHFDTWFDSLLSSSPAVFAAAPRVEHPIRWLSGSAIDSGHVLVSELARSAELVRGTPALVQGIEGPCDMYVFHEFGIPAVLWGARGGNTHNPDEYVEIDSVVDAAAVLLDFICRWCGVVD